MPSALQSPLTDAQRLAAIGQLQSRKLWAEVARMGEGLELTADRARMEVLDSVAFALSRLKRHADALDLMEPLHAAAPTRRRAGAVAYVCYDALLGGVQVRGRSTDQLRDTFLARVKEQMVGDPAPVVALYRRGTFHAKVEAARDREALEDYEAAIAAYEALDAATREPRHQLLKPYVKSLYGAARSALELRQPQRAKRHIARCLRVDERTNHVEPVFKLYVAAKACADAGDPARAERGLRLALQAGGPPDRTFVHHKLAEVRAAQGDAAGALDWLEKNVPPARRPPYVQVTVGDLLRSLGRIDDAIRAWESALFRDREMRHLTLCRLGEAHLERKELGKARHRFEEALRLRRKRDEVTDRRAAAGLLEVARAEGRTDEAARLEAELKELEHATGRPGAIRAARRR